MELSKDQARSQTNFWTRTKAPARDRGHPAKDAGLGRESLYKTLSAGAHPRFETINSVLHALGVKFAVVTERES